MYAIPMSTGRGEVGGAAGRSGGPVAGGVGALAAHVDPCLKYGSLECLQVDKRIGKGQFSEVFRAFSRFDGTPVALKKVQVRAARARAWHPAPRPGLATGDAWPLTWLEPLLTHNSRCCPLSLTSAAPSRGPRSRQAPVVGTVNTKNLLAHLGLSNVSVMCEHFPH